MYGGFGNNVGIQAVAQVDGVDVVAMYLLVAAWTMSFESLTIQDRCT